MNGIIDAYSVAVLTGMFIGAVVMFVKIVVLSKKDDDKKS